MECVRLLLMLVSATFVCKAFCSLQLRSSSRSIGKVPRFFLAMSVSSFERIRLVTPSSADERKGKIIMIHGWAQNAAVMRSKSKGLTRKLNQAGYDVVFLDGPHVLPMTSMVEVEGTAVEVENGKRENARAWFLLSQEDPADASLSQSGIPMTYIGIDESCAILEDELRKNDDDNDEFVAVFGFSQGGVFAHVLSTLAMQQHDPFQRIKCAIFASAFVAQHVPDEASSFQLQNLSTITVTLPSLHLIGANDTSVCPKLSLELVNLFKDGEVLMHAKGHILSQNSAQCATVISFLDRNH